MSDSVSKIALIDAVGQADKASIALLLNCLEDENLAVRWNAYDRLKILQPKDETAKKALSQGVLLKPTDIVYSVYKSGLSYTDTDYIIFDGTYHNEPAIYGENLNLSGYSLENSDIIPELISTHLSKESAELIARELMRSILVKEEPYYLIHFCTNNDRIEISQQDIYDWASQCKISELPQPENPQPFERVEGLSFDSEEYEDYRDKLEAYCYQLQWYAADILEFLDVERHYDVIENIYTHIVGKLAYVRQETVAETTYLVF
jgi:hypothetical protein